MKEFLGDVYSDLGHISYALERVMHSKLLADELESDLKVILMAIESVQSSLEIKASILKDK